MTVNGFYNIESFSFDGAVISVHLSLVPTHWICDVHFPGSPIMPGAMVVNTLQQLVSKAFERHYIIDKLSNVRFLRPIVPGRETALRFDIAVTLEEGENGAFPPLSVKCVVKAEGTTSAAAEEAPLEFVKLSAHLITSK
ncbi:MAG: hypothetical protein IKI67_07345 [Bacteroidales bacterium]|nr:hypothetical protein [Bacteroidales bacterium]